MPPIFASDYSTVLVKLSIYARDLKRESNGLPAHPKAPRILCISKLADETGISPDILRKPVVQAHLERLVACHGLRDPVRERRLLAAEKIRTKFANRPLLRRGHHVHLERVAHEAGVQLQDLSTPECRRVIDDLVAKNGTTRQGLDIDAERAALQAYQASLQATGNRVPVNTANGKADIRKIATAIDVPRGRFGYDPLRSGLVSMIADLGLETVKTLADEVADLTIYVEAKIALATRVPCSRTGGIAHVVISRDLGISPHRLRTHAPMRTLLHRWQSTTGLSA